MELISVAPDENSVTDTVSNVESSETSSVVIVVLSLIVVSSV